MRIFFLLLFLPTLCLAEDPSWLALGHYLENKFLPGYTSLVDDPDFFLAVDGKTNPEAELAASKNYLFGPNKAAESERCRFIARDAWIRKKFNISAPPLVCPKFNEWFTGIKPEAISLVYAASYLNNPASSFGHTLLRFDSTQNGVRVPVLAYAANYAAATGEDPGLLYAVRGIFGGYSGFFSIGPYYIHLRKYSDVESRDLWEYEFDLKKEEITFLMQHLWELKEINFDYFFFDENCSYQLLWMIHLLRPEAGLLDQFRYWAIPSDTVRAVTQSPGLVSKVTYRPATGTALRAHENQFSANEIAAIKELAFGSSPIGSESARVLEGTTEYLSYLDFSGKLSQDQARAREFQILQARSKIAEPKALAPIPVPPVQPDQGHKTGALAFSTGSVNRKAFGEFRFRPVYHETLDPQDGHPRGSSINLMDTHLRITEGGSTTLEELALVRVDSLTPRSAFLKPKAWKMDLGLKRKNFGDGEEHLSLGFRGGLGLSYLLSNSVHTYGLISGAIETGSHYASDYSAGLGPTAGLFIDQGEAGRSMLEARYLHYGLGDDHFGLNLEATQAIHIADQQSLRISYAWEKEFDDINRTAKISWYVYY